MQRELNLLNGIFDEELQEAFELISSYSGVIEASVLSSYEEFLEVVLGYISEECKKDKVDDNKIRLLISRAAKVINNAEKTNVNKNKEEIKEIKGKVIKELIDCNNKNADIFEFGVSKRLKVDFNSELYSFIKENIKKSSITKRQIINYLFTKYGILNKEDFEGYQYDEDDFLDFIVKQRMTRSIPFAFEDLIDILRQIIEEEKDDLKYKVIGRDNTTHYQSKYPSLARVFLLIDTKDEIIDLIEKYKNEPKFVEYLHLFIRSLSNYDKTFMNEMKINLPVSKFSNIIKLILEREMDSDKRFYYNAKNTQLVATVDGYEEKSIEAEGKLKPKEILACIPDDFKDKMYSTYNETDENEYAVLLSRIISKYCKTKDDKKLSPARVQVMLLNLYRQYIDNLSKEFESSPQKIKIN